MSVCGVGLERNSNHDARIFYQLLSSYVAGQSSNRHKYLQKMQGWKSYIQVLTSAYTASCRPERTKMCQEGLGEGLGYGTTPLDEV